MNAGQFSDTSLYTTGTVSGVETTALDPLTPITTSPAPIDVAATTATASTPTAAATTAGRTFSTLLLDTSVGAAAVGTAAAVAVVAASSGGGGGSNDATGSSSGATDYFNRASLPNTATPASFVDAEFNASRLGGLGKINAQYAYAKGLSGAGVKIGFQDWFTNDQTTNAELSSRVVYRNLNISGDTAFLANDCYLSNNDPEACDHGGSVMGYAANARNGLGTLGVAYGANLMMNSVRGTANMRVLADQGANIVNFSCGGCGENTDVALFNSLQYLANHNVLMTSATGNEGYTSPTFDTPAYYANLLDYSLLAVTGVEEVNGALVNSYNNCGVQKEFCLTAYADTGTSFAAPQVAGAAALIKEGWSYLTAKQIGQILLYSAKDIGAAGVDTVYGHGLLDLQAAVGPIGSVTVASRLGSTTSFAPSTITQNQSSAFGNAFAASTNAKGNVVAIDSFGRDFAIKPQDNMVMAKAYRFTSDTLNNFGRNPNALRPVKVNDALSLSFSRQDNTQGTTDILGFAEYKITPTALYKMGFATDMSRLEDMTENDPTQTFNKANFISTDIFQNGFLHMSDNNQVFNQSITLNPDAKFKTTVSTYYSQNNNTANYFNPTSNGITSDFSSSIINTQYAPADNMTVNFKNGVTHEFNSVLGMQTSGSFAMADGANTYFTGFDVGYNITPHWSVSGSYLFGVTKAKPSAASAFTDISDIMSDSFALTATRTELLGHDSLSLSVGQPTRVRSGAASGLTQTVDHNTGAISTAAFQQDMVPTGRTLELQAAYQTALSDDIAMNFAVKYENQPYQQADMPADASGLLKFVYRWN